MADGHIDDEDLTAAPATSCLPFQSSTLCRPVSVDQPGLPPTRFWTWPFGSLLFENETSDARDHCAPKPSFLSYLRLSIYMSVVSVAIVLSFHLKNQPSELELRMARPLGATFWALSVCCLFLGVGNYVKTVNKYGRKAAIVQTGWRTQLVLTIVAMSIVGTCIVLLIIAKIGAHGSTP
ncbi:hypothetical protein SODALDRAFT_326002 [Sodiomyces alkalinus F11]|uniref:DUF202 domain-containing protein n=1 Tax=Sodiomyces alkalinus (strain CBS 110278 / VKM F-3762 / F11) TaxID=1314773 RepID=A0A3N2Q4X6_SODAK|nr:hypothetical protein SODALDRAFT_326002 [Sodiomyces alkalinus F11]ROT41820.1 hypothetical protein SODALDRAFT_326002 [Sodiomyces alkalinus F11]